MVQNSLLALVLVLAFATDAWANEVLWDEAERMEALVEAAQDRAEASDPATDLGDRLHSEGLAAHQELRSYLKQLLALSPPIHPQDREVVMQLLLTSLEADAVLRLRRGDCEDARTRLDHLARLEEVVALEALHDVTVARGLDAGVCITAQNLGAHVAEQASSIEPPPPWLLTEPRARGNGVVVAGGAGIVAGGILAGLSRHSLQSARAMVRTGSGSVDEYNAARRRGDRAAVAASALAGAGSVVVITSLVGRNEGAVNAAIGPREVTVRVRW